jgi:SAM-dependent methyltransferase
MWWEAPRPSMSVTATYLPRRTTRDKRVSPPRAYGRYAIALRLRDAVVGAVRGVAAEGRPALLDLGCGDMPYRPLLEPVLSSYRGVDLPGNSLASYHLLDSDGPPLTTAPSGEAGIVLSTQVLEHVRDVPGYLSEARRLLAADGRLVLTTHGTWVYHADPNDYWRWTSQGLREVVEDAGFVVERIEGLLGLMPLGIQLFQDGLVRKLPRWTRPTLCLLAQQAMLLTDLLHSPVDRSRDACVFLVVARRRS